MAKTEIGRFGNLNDNYGYLTDVYGLAIGRYETGRPNLIYDSATGKMSFNVYNTPYMVFEYNSGNPRVYLGNTVNSVELVTSGLSVGTTGKISGGDVIYGYGDGFWLGYDAGKYKAYIGNASNSLKYDGTNLTLTGAFQGTKTSFSDDSDGFWLGPVSGTYKLYIGNNTEYIKWDGDSLTIAGGITTDTVNVGTTGAVYGGQSDWDTGVGFWLGYKTDAHKLSFGSSTGKKLLWDGTNLTWTTGKTSAEVDGTFRATDAIISGTITANTGYIGGPTGWAIATGKITSTGIGVATAAGDATYAFWAGDNTPASAEFSVKHDGSLKATSADITGVITANTGYIGGASGWTIAAGKITSTGIGVATATGDATYAFWAGDNTPASAEFSVKHDGTFKSTAGTVGGWTIGATAITAGTGTSTVGLDTSGGSVPAFYAGNATPASAPFRVYQNGSIVATSATISGEITANSGKIGGANGWVIDTNMLYSKNLSIGMDSLNDYLYVGDLHLHGATSTIHSSDYSSGISGFSLSPDYLEVNNINARGMIRTAVFQKDMISVVGGTVVILPGDVLATDMTASTTTMIASGTHTFTQFDVVRIKDGADDEWLYITDASAAPTYTVQRDLAGVYPVNANPAWKKGSSIVSYQGWSEGGLKLTSTETNAPFLSVFVRPASTTYPYNSGGLIEKVRLGNLTGIDGTSGYGLWTDNCYLIGKLQTGSGNQKCVLDSSDNTLRLYDTSGYNTFTIDDTLPWSVDGYNGGAGLLLSEGALIISGSGTNVIISGSSMDYNFISKNTIATGLLYLTSMSIRAGATGAYTLLINTASGFGGNRTYTLPDKGNNATFDLTVPSDVRLKENIIPSKYGLNIINNIKIVDFNFVGDKKEITGAIAQEVRDIYPQIVHENNDGYLNIEYKDFIPLMIKSIQELHTKIKDLEKDNKVLHKKVKELEIKYKKL